MIFCFFEKLFLILDSFPSFSPSICKTFCVNSRRYNTCQENWRKCILLQVSHNYAPYRWVTSCICKHRIYTGIQSVKIYNHSYMQLASRAVSDICLKTRDLFWTLLKLLKNLKNFISIRLIRTSQKTRTHIAYEKEYIKQIVIYCYAR